MLRNPKMQEVMASVMKGGPDAYKEFADDPEVAEMLRKVQGRVG